MSRRPRTAKDCDWSFLQDARAEEVIRQAAVDAAARYPGEDADDLYQEAVLYLGSHPERVNHHLAGENYGWLYGQVYRDLVQDTGRRLGRRPTEVNYDDWELKVINEGW